MLATPPPYASEIESELESLLARYPMRRPSLEWRRFRTTAGRADFQHWRIELGPAVLSDLESARETLIHEYAHLLAVHRDGRSAANHGPAWQKAMRDLGSEPRRTHSLPVKRNRSRAVAIYRCQGCGNELVRSRRLPARRRYAHVGCGGRIVFIERRTVSDALFTPDP